MFPVMRRSDLELPREKLLTLLADADWISVAFNSPLGYPYITAVNHVIFKERVYFHCASEGFKLDCLEQDQRVCLQAVVAAEIIAEEYTTRYLSVTAFGRARLLESKEEKRLVLIELMKRFAPSVMPECISQDHGGLSVVEVVVDHVTGKGRWR
ncbi:MAG: hypothetical protein FH749_07655 [Firmicutes bacterium]|nr:hypothetical protein [Bacillota bacterium]